MLTLLLTHAAMAGGPCVDLVQRLDQAGDCLTVPLLGAAQEARERGCVAELDQALIARGLHPVGPRTPSHRPPTPAPDKLERDHFNESYPHSWTTDNFVIKWGDDTSFGTSHAVELGRIFEHAWEVEVGEWGYPPPSQTDAHLFNVYIGDSGGGTPSAAGNAGYYTRDGAGYPYIVVADFVASSRSAQFTASHEFFHSLQDSTGTYSSGGQSAWFWEATAVWSEEEIFPDEPEASDFLPSWAFLPELPINAFNWEGEGWYGSSHQYGAFLFPRWLTEHHGGRDFMYKLWVESPPATDPLRTIDELLLAQGADGVEAAFFGFLDSAATWDFERANAYALIIEGAGGWGSFSSHRPVGTIRGTSEWREPSVLEPYTYGAGYWRVYSYPEEVVVEFEALDDARSWHAAVAWREGDEHRVQVLDLVDGVGSTEILGLDDPAVDDIWIVVGVVDGFRDFGKTFPYRVRWTEVEEVTDTGEEDPRRVCGCSQAPAVAGWWLALVPLLGIRRRR